MNLNESPTTMQIMINGKPFHLAPGFWDWARDVMKPETVANLPATGKMLTMASNAYRDMLNTQLRVKAARA